MSDQYIVDRLKNFTAQVYTCHTALQLAYKTDSCDMSDALCTLKYGNGGFLLCLTMWSPECLAGKTKILGPAYMVKFVLEQDTAPGQSTHYVRSFYHRERKLQDLAKLSIDR
jgi:hypothetical protein